MMQPPPQMQPPGGPLGRASAHEGDRVDPFMSGDHYGPVLEPFLVRIVGAQIKVNPLLQPVPDEADRPYLKWNMLFPSSNCQRSTDPSHISWVEGRHEPATFPRVSSLQIVSDGFPWMVKVEARRPETGVTCGDVIDRLSGSMNTLSSGADYEALPPHKKRLIAEAYQHNRSRAHGVPGGMLEVGMKRLDFLGKDTIFGGIVNDEEYLTRHAGVVLPCTFVLKCLRRFAMTAEEIRDHEARQRAAAAQDTRRATVTTDSDDDDDDT
ncbi:hypothetical protein BDZ94DRAFT_1256068 [Collybia nuda]|uniref:DUF6699 domain-containing protein n=1 Tax=Collybia nuda TaxID=64659 RepID=A0A9P5Y968_9AGAR|nr:hypothetical protein BDZ94DRAFT_1256068 [Collybia nuda]